MQAKGVFTVAKGALLPGDERAHDMFAQLKIGDRVLVKVHRARNPEHNALAHAVFDRLAAATGYPSKAIKLFLKRETGRVDLIKLPDGKYIQSPHSLKFSQMSQDDFQAFWDEAWLIITEKMLPNIPQEEFETIRAIVAGEPHGRPVSHSG